MSLTGFTPVGIATNVYYVLVLCSLFLQAIFWQLALRKYPLSIAYFFMSGVYGVILIGSYFIYGEAVSVNNIMGTLIIIIGIIIMFR